MLQLTKRRLERILTENIGMKDPEFDIEKFGKLWGGNIISNSFKNKDDHERQDMIWRALRKELNGNAENFVGMLSGLTPLEWSFKQLGEDLPPKQRKRRAKLPRKHAA